MSYAEALKDWVIGTGNTHEIRLNSRFIFLENDELTLEDTFDFVREIFIYLDDESYILDDDETILDMHTDEREITNCFYGEVRAASDLVPEDSIFCTPILGGSTDPIHSDMTATQYHQAQIRIRNPNFELGQNITEDINALLISARVPGYWYTRPIGSSPAYLNADEEGNHHWAINVEMRSQSKSMSALNRI